MNRRVEETVQLSDGIVLPKGAMIIVPTTPMQDPAIYPNPNMFDGHRFFRMRQEQGSEHRFQFTSVSPQHFGFGYGKHACPGRFFVTNQIKVMLIHLILNYDWKFHAHQNGRPKSLERGAEIVVDPTVTILYRARKPEIRLSILA